MTQCQLLFEWPLKVLHIQGRIILGFMKLKILKWRHSKQNTKVSQSCSEDHYGDYLQCLLRAGLVWETASSDVTRVSVGGRLQARNWNTSVKKNTICEQDTLTHHNLWRLWCIVGNVHIRFRQERRRKTRSVSLCCFSLHPRFTSDMILHVKLSSFLNLLVWFLCRKTSRRSCWSIRTRSSGCRRNTHFS